MSILLQDNFTGTTIDTGKWTETDPNSRITQNNLLSLSLSNTTNIGEFTNKLESVSSVTSGTSVVQGLLDWTDGGSDEPFAGIYLWKDDSNFAYIGARSGGGTYRLRVISGGSSAYNLESTIANGKDVKIVNTGSAISFYYWSGSAWAQIGTTTTVSLGYNIKYVISFRDFNTTSGANPTTIDNAYFSNTDYTTQYPSSGGPANLKSYNTNLKANIKSINTNLIANVKSVNTIT